jgi:ABC-type Fe3+/spermidine/putrescine transport system ATPase subunit
MSTPYLTIDRVGKRYPQGGGVDEIDLSIPRGAMLVLLGPSGSGKTTLLRTIAGLVPADTGRILLGDRDITRVPVARRRVGMVFQTWALFPHMTAFDNVAFGLRMQKVPKAELTTRVEEALALVHLEDFAARLPRQLSGGQQQRVALARAIVTRPDLLLFDEPLSSLDHRIRLELRSQLRQIQHQLGLTGVYVTHDHSEALALGDDIAVMDQGRIVERGAPHAIFTRPTTRFTAEFLSTGTVLDVVSVHPRDGQAEVVTAAGLRFVLPRTCTDLEEITALSIPSRAIRVEPFDEAAPAGTAGLIEGEVSAVEYEQASLLCSIRLVDHPVVLKSIQPLEREIGLGDRVRVWCNEDQVLPLR